MTIVCLDSYGPSVSMYVYVPWLVASGEGSGLAAVRVGGVARVEGGGVDEGEMVDEGERMEEGEGVRKSVPESSGEGGS